MDADLARYPPVDRLRTLAEAAGFEAWVGTQVTAETQVVDAAAYEAKSFSVLHLISQASFEAGLARLRADLERGPLVAIGSYVLLWASKVHQP